MSAPTVLPPWLRDQPPYAPVPSQEQDAIARIAEARNGEKDEA